MKTVGLITEYNPFHNGHQFHIEKTREICQADAVIALMSGNYVQRGDVAIFNKSARAIAAIKGGADLVLELPTVCAMQSAEFFAKNSVFLLNALGCVDFISFGVENNNIELIKSISDLLINEPVDFSNRLKDLSSSGVSFPLARKTAISEFLGKEAGNFISEPNNILAVEYCKALKLQNSGITPIAISRKGVGHNSEAASSCFASATHIRGLLENGSFDEAFSYMPVFCKDIFKNEKKHSIKNMEKAIISNIIKTSAEQLKNTPDVTEGIENRIKAKALIATSIDALADEIKTKRYTHSRIRRILLSAYLGITDCDRNALPPYIKILAHNETGQQLIQQIKKAASLPLVRNTSQINKLNNPALKQFWERERVFDTLYDFF